MMIVTKVDDKDKTKRQRGRPAIGRAVQVNIAMRPELMRRLDELAAALGKNRSEIMRFALQLMLSTHELTAKKD